METPIGTSHHEEDRPITAPPEIGVLIVEDNALVQDMLAYGIRKYFRGRDAVARIATAGSGTEALRELGQRAFQLAIVDYYMPIMDGAALVRRLRAIPELPGLMIVAISVGGAEARTAMLRAGADLYLDKPVVAKDLFAILDRLTAAGGTP